MKTNLKPSLEKVLSFIQPDGVVAEAITGFELRKAQEEMVASVLEAYHDRSVALIEAGTGTGKSLAYLLPALIWAVENKERTVISTHTIALQEQLLLKDLPLLIDALGLDIEVVLAKGISNYVCLRKLKEARESSLFFSEEEEKLFQTIDDWSQTTDDGSLSDLSFQPSYKVVEELFADSDSCHAKECPFFEKCHFFKARKKAEEASIIVVNHHLLFADLSLRKELDNYDTTALLPSYKRLILDEAHHISEVATYHFASKLSQLDFVRLFSRLLLEKGNLQTGKLALLKERLIKRFGYMMPATIQAIYERLTVTLPAKKRELLGFSKELFDLFYEAIFLLKGEKSHKFRLLSSHLTHPFWKEDIQQKTKEFLELLRAFIADLKGLNQAIVALEDERFKEETKNLRLDLDALRERFEEECLKIELFVQEKEEGNKVRWIEFKQSKFFENITLYHADLEIAPLLQQALFSKLSTTVLCSATLSTNKEFEYIKRELGLYGSFLESKKVSQALYPSPFNYLNQALLMVPLDLPLPNDARFVYEASMSLFKFIEISRGGVFILFTSYQMLEQSFSLLQPLLEERGFSLFKQGTMARNTLLKEFKKNKRSVLFGTDSFWEGVDVAGQALRCVVIVKLPFQVPNEPLIEAKIQEMERLKRSPFFDYMVPKAIVKFKQGFGRLIRKKSDRGCVICLDTRIAKKGYGRMFLNSLPECTLLFDRSDRLEQEMKKFYGRKEWSVTESNR